MGISGAAIGKPIIYKEPGRLAVVSGLIIGTVATTIANVSPPLTNDDHVHIVCFVPFISAGWPVPTSAPGAPVTASGMYQVLDVPYWALGHGGTYASITPGSWAWPF